MISLVRAILLLTVFLIPLIGAYQGFGYEQIKVAFFVLSNTLIGFLWLFSNPQIKWTNIKIASSLFILTLFLTSTLGIDPRISIFGNSPYFQGLIFYCQLYLFSLIVSTINISFKSWAIVFTASSAIVSLLAIKDWTLLNVFNVQIPNYAGRVVSTFGQPNFYAGFLLLTLPFFHFFLKKKTSFWPWIMFGFLITILAIIFSYSRISFLMLSLLILFWLIWELPFRKLIFWVSLIILSIIFVLSINFGAGWMEKELLELKTTTNPDLTTIGVEKRYYFWPILGKLVLERPIQGYGLENIASVFFGYFEKNKHILFEENLRVQPYMFGLKDLNLDRSHNYILDLLIFSGILGLLVWLFLVGLLIKKLIQSPVRAENTSLLLGLFTYLIWIQFQNQSVVHLIYFWLLLGMIDQEKTLPG